MVAHSLLLSSSGAVTDFPEYEMQAKISEAMKHGKKRNNRLSVFFIGQDRVGKTSLKKSILGEALDTQEPSTLGIDFDVVEVRKDEAREPWRTTEEKRLIASEEYMNEVVGKDAARRISEDSSLFEHEKQRKHGKDEEDKNQQEEYEKSKRDETERPQVEYEEDRECVGGEALLSCSGIINDFAPLPNFTSFGTKFIKLSLRIITPFWGFPLTFLFLIQLARNSMHFPSVGPRHFFKFTINNPLLEAQRGTFIIRTTYAL